MTTGSCSCGRAHNPGCQLIVNKEKALDEISGFLRAGGFSNLFIIADANTYPLAGAELTQRLKDFHLSQYVFRQEEPVPDEKALGSLLTAISPQVEIIIASGSGTINDMSRYLSYRLKIPYVIVPTAASMDGYASSVSPLLVDSLKTTYEAVVAAAIFADPDIYKTAPGIMNRAGLGDMAGKFSCLNDWLLGRLLFNEYYCQEVASLTRQSAERALLNGAAIGEGNQKALTLLMDSLIMSGEAMSYVGNSRPASGAEHHIAHFWEMSYIFSGKKPLLHGLKVGIAALAVFRMYKMLLEKEPDFAKGEKLARELNFEKYEQKMKTAFGPAAGGIIAQEEKCRRSFSGEALKRIGAYRQNWDGIRKILEFENPGSEQVETFMKAGGCLLSPKEAGMDRETFVNGILFAKEIRNRFTILQIIGDLGLLEDFAERLAEEYY